MHFYLFPTALAVEVGGNQRHENGSGRVAAENFISPARFPRYWPILVANRQRNPMRPSWELQAQPSPAQRPFQGSLRTTSKEPRRCSRPVTPAVHVPPKDTPRCDTATRLGTGCCCTCGWLFWGRGRTSVLTASFPRVRPQRPPKGLMVVDVVVAVTAVIAVELSPVDGNSYPRAWKAERVGSWRRPRPFPTETQHTLTRSSPAKAKERWLRRSNGPRSKTRSCRTTQRARADTSAASVTACTPPACLQEGGGRARNSSSPWGPGRLDRLAPIPPGPFLGLFLPTVPLCQVLSLSPGSSHSFPLYIIFSCPSSVSLHHIRYCPYFHPVCRSRKGISTANHSRSLTPTTTTPRSIDPAASSHRAPVQRQRKRPSRPA